MLRVFTIVANEVIGLSATECTLMQFSYNPEQIHDPESVLRSAVKDYLKTDEGKRRDDYYIIDMALAENSALNDCVPREKLRAYPQQWLPMATNS